MYLNKLTLNLRSKEARRDLGDAYEMHRTLARAFAANDQKPVRFLWRLEVGADPCAAPAVLVQSGVPSDWSFLQTLRDYARLPVECKHLPLEKLIQEGRCYRFRLMANPTVTRQGKRLGLVGAADQLAWLTRQGYNHGFTIEAAEVSAGDVLSSHKGRNSIYVQRACFNGVLRAIGPEALRAALRSGIGPAKAFGCGLLSVAPA